MNQCLFAENVIFLSLDAYREVPKPKQKEEGGEPDTKKAKKEEIEMVTVKRVITCHCYKYMIEKGSIHFRKKANICQEKGQYVLGKGTIYVRKRANIC